MSSSRPSKHLINVIIMSKWTPDECQHYPSEHLINVIITQVNNWWMSSSRPSKHLFNVIITSKWTPDECHHYPSEHLINVIITQVNNWWMSSSRPTEHYVICHNYIRCDLISCVMFHATYIDPFRAGIDFRREKLTSVGVRSKVDPRTVRNKILIMAVDS